MQLGHERRFRPHPTRAVLALAIATGLLATAGLPLHAATPTASPQTQAPGQDQQDQKGKNKVDDGTMALETVIVTARRHAERMVDVPIAMTAMTGTEIRELGLENVADVIGMTPGAASITSGGGLTQVQIRGVSTSLGGNANGYYLDGVPFTGVSVPWYPDARSWDIARVEVLKGPQGTTFGEGSMGGTIRIITRKPDFNQFEAAINLNASSTQGGSNGWGGKALVNIPLIEDKFAVRVDATDEVIAGWIDAPSANEANINENRIKTGRVKLRYAPTERLNINFSYWKYWLRADDGSNSALDDMTVASYASTYDPWSSKTAVATYDFDHSQLFYSWGDTHLLNESLGTLAPGLSYSSAINLNVRTQELRWSSTGERTLDWTVGYYLRKASRHDKILLGEMPPNGSQQTNDGYAVYGETILKMPDPRWALTTGLRYFSDDVKARSVSEANEVVMDARFSSWSPHIGLSFKPTENSLLYFDAAKGFRSGQLQPITSFILAQAAGLDLPAQIKPDSIITYEIGAKSQFLGGRLVVRGDIFYSNWKDVAVRVPINETFNGLANSKGTRNRGVEFNVSYSPNPMLRMSLGGSYVDAVYMADVPDTPLHKGTPVYNVPKKTLNGMLSYRHPISTSLNFITRGSFVYTSARETALTQGTPGDPISRVDARVGLEALAGWSLYLYGDNLTDEDGAVDARLMNGTATRLQPRTVGIEFGYRY